MHHGGRAAVGAAIMMGAMGAASGAAASAEAAAAAEVALLESWHGLPMFKMRMCACVISHSRALQYPAVYPDTALYRYPAGFRCHDHNRV